MTLGLTGALAASAQAIDDTDTVTIDATRVIRRLAGRPTGVNANFLTDADTRRAPGARPLQAALEELAAPPLARRWEFHGTSPEDFTPAWSEKSAVPVAVGSGMIELTLPPLSITVLRLDGASSDAKPVATRRRSR